VSVEESLADKAAALKGVAVKRSRKTTWIKPTGEDFADGLVLAFDQTFSKTGWCLVDVKDGEVDVQIKGFIQEPPIPDKPAFEDILQRSEWMYDRIYAVIWEATEWGPFGVVHEAPVLHAMRVEASLLGALAVRLATRKVLGQSPVIIENRRMLGLLVPPDERYNQTGKSHITRALLPYYDTRKGWNEHNRDALALALTHLYDKKRAT
jgi:hypothetical protein